MARLWRGILSSYTPGLEAGAEALGWQLDKINLDLANPGPAVQQAIDAGVDYIAITSQPAAVIDEQLALARQKGIPVFSCFGVDEPLPEVNGFFTQCANGEYLAEENRLLGEWAIETADGKANVVNVTVRDLPILVAGEEGLASALKGCADCKLDTLPVTFDDVAKGDVPQIISSYLQSNPNTTHVVFAYPDLASGVTDTVAGAGLADNVKFGGVAFDESRLKAIVDGSEQAWTAQPADYLGWIYLDAMARHSVGMPLDTVQADIASVSTFLVSDKATAQKILDDGGAWTGPVGYEDSFRKLWLLN